MLWLPSTAVGDGEALVAAVGDGEVLVTAVGCDAGTDGEAGVEDEEPGVVTGEDVALPDGGEEGAPDEAAEDEGVTPADCAAVSVAPGDAFSGTGEGLEVP